MVSRRVKLIYPPQLVHQPIIYELGKQFEVVTNIRQARVASNHGWLVTDLRGEDATVNRAIAWLREQGIEVQEQKQAEP